jgi:hypothetical protein
MSGKISSQNFYYHYLPTVAVLSEMIYFQNVYLTNFSMLLFVPSSAVYEISSNSLLRPVLRNSVTIFQPFSTVTSKETGNAGFEVLTAVLQNKPS